MSQRTNPALVGAFVLGALALLVAGALLLGQDRWFKAADSFVVYFDESLKGLRVGAAVAYRGVEVGEVASITAVLEPKTNALFVPVVVKLRKDALVLEGGGEPTPETMTALIELGLRAQLQLESLVTGRLYVGLDFFPNQPPRLVTSNSKLPQIPSVRSPLSGILRSVDELTLASPKLLAEATDIVSQLRELLAGDTGKALQQTVRSAASLVTSLDDPEGPLKRTLGELPPTLEHLRATATGLDELVAKVNDTVSARDEQLGELLAELTRTSAAIRRTADQASTMVVQSRAGIQDFATRGLPELTGLVEDANRMVNEINSLVRDIRQNPVRFLLGDQTREGVKLK